MAEGGSKEKGVAKNLYVQESIGQVKIKNATSVETAVTVIHMKKGCPLKIRNCSGVGWGTRLSIFFINIKSI